MAIALGTVLSTTDVPGLVGGTDVAILDGGTGSSTASGARTNLGVGTGDSPTFAGGTFTGDVLVQGNMSVTGASVVTSSEIQLISDNHLYLNAGYTTAVGQTGGLVVNFQPSATATTVAAGGFTAGVNAVSNPRVITVGSATFAAGDIVQFSGANKPENNGLFEVLSHVTTTLTIRGIGVTACTENFTQNQFTTDTTVAGTITKTYVSVIRCATSGMWETGYGQTTGIAFGTLYQTGGSDVAVADGGTGVSSWTTGDIVYASGTTTLAGLADVAVGRVLVSGGVSTAPSYSASPSLGVAGTIAGSLALAGVTSGNVTIDVAAAAGTWNFTLPITAGTANYAMITDGSGNASWSILPVAGGGTGLTSYTTGDIMHASAAGTLAGLADVAVGSVLVSGGVGAAPSWSSGPSVTSLTVAASNAVNFGTTATQIVNTGGSSLEVKVSNVSVATFSGSGAMTIAGALDHDGSTVGFYGVAPAARSTGWAVTNSLSDKVYDANATTLDEVSDVLGTLITHLITIGLIGA